MPVIPWNPNPFCSGGSSAPLMTSGGDSGGSDKDEPPERLPDALSGAGGKSTDDLLFATSASIGGDISDEPPPLSPDFLEGEDRSTTLVRVLGISGMTGSTRDRSGLVDLAAIGGGTLDDVGLRWEYDSGIFGDTFLRTIDGSVVPTRCLSASVGLGGRSDGSTGSYCRGRRARGSLATYLFLSIIAAISARFALDDDSASAASSSVSQAARNNPKSSMSFVIAEDTPFATG